MLLLRFDRPCIKLKLRENIHFSSWFIRAEIIQEFFAVLNNPITSWLQYESTCKAIAFDFFMTVYFSRLLCNVIKNFLILVDVELDL